MTPEDLEAIPGIGPDLVEHIRDVVVSYYGQYDDGSELPQDDESQEQQPTLEMGEEGYNYSESDKHRGSGSASGRRRLPRGCRHGGFDSRPMMVRCQPVEPAGGGSE